MKKLLLALSVVSMLGACASKSGPKYTYQNMLDSWAGHNIKEVVEIWGVPNKQVELPDGTKAFQYDEMISVSLKRANNDWWDPEVESTKNYCKTIFMTNIKGKILRSKHEGNRCQPDKQKAAKEAPAGEIESQPKAPSV